MRRPSTFPFLASLLIIIALATSRIVARDLGFDERVRAQSAIERVYYSHQIGATRSFEETVPRSVLERKVATYLQQSIALERFWHRPITAEVLRREMERMVHRTRMPDRLRELFAALDNDPFLIQECLARPALAARLVDSYAAFDDRIHRAERDEALRLRRELSLGAPHSPPAGARLTLVEIVEGGHASAGRTHAVPDDDADPDGIRRVEVGAAEFQAWRRKLPRRAGEPGPLREEREAFVTFVLLDSSEQRLRVAAYSVPKRSRSDWWQEVERELDPSLVRAVAAGDVSLPPIGAEASLPCACGSADFWDNGSLDDMPEPRADHSAAWTGSLMIVWGGEISLGHPTNTGGRYDPATDTWSPTSMAGAPQARELPTLLWTGDRVILWAGSWFAPNTGALYDPLSDSWAPISTSGAPPRLVGYTAIWTGTEMIVWGGYDPTAGILWNQGYRYDPFGNKWTITSVVGAPSPRWYASAVWTGTEMILWSGSDLQNNYLSSGGRYDPVGDTWASMSSINAPPASQTPFAAWTGDRMLMVNRYGTAPAGGLYDPDLDSWSGISTSGAPVNRSDRTAVWSGSELIVWGGVVETDPPVFHNDGGRYSPSTDTWTATSPAVAPSGRYGHTAVWTGEEMIVWGGDDGKHVNSGGRYNPEGDTWVPTSTGPGPSPRITDAVWTGSRMLIWGGYARAPGGVTFSYWGSGGLYDPALDTWLPISDSDAPSPRRAPVVWTGNHMVVWGGYDGTTRLATGGRYDPVADAWSPTSLSGAPAARSSHVAVWSGTEMMVWGGSDGTSRLATGGRYNPLLDAWIPLSQINAPPAVSSPLALWAGNRMLVWGGTDQGYGAVNTGGLYDPVYDSWRPTSVTGAPSRRYGASGVWTGSRVIIWGGEDEIGPGPFNTGGRYDPVSDTWLPTSLTGVPRERSYQSALWTGTRMVLWGGYRYVDLNPYDAYLSSGGIYDPVANSWSETPEAGAPKGRALHASIWTGEKMLVWGGWVGSGTASGGGGSYCGVFPPHYYEDGDADGYGDSLSSVISCGQPMGYVPLPGDCAISDAARWAAPSEALNVRFNDATTLAWSAPAQMGATSVLYDALRSVNPSDFVGGGTCLVTDSALLSATDATVPASGAVLNYLVRAQNGCPSGSGSLGNSSGGITRAGLNCP